MMRRAAIALTSLAAGALFAQDAATPQPQDPPAAVRRADGAAQGGYRIDAGTKVPLSLLNSVSTKHSIAGERIYLETVFPILAGGRIVIPPGSYVAGTVTAVKKPGRVKGRGELYVRFDSLTLPNGVTRDFRARLSASDASAAGELDRDEGMIRSEGNKAGDARTVGEAAATGASVGVIAGGAAGHYGLGAGIGAAAGAAAGMVGVLLSRGPDAILAKGSTIEMVLDRNLHFDEGELNFTTGYQAPRASSEIPAAQQQKSSGGIPMPGRRFPL
jgi:type IV secretion system protein VirB10